MAIARKGISNVRTSDRIAPIESSEPREERTPVREIEAAEKPSPQRIQAKKRGKAAPTSAKAAREKVGDVPPSAAKSTERSLPTEQTRPFAPEAAFVPLASVSAEVVVLSPTFVSGGKKRPETPRLNVLLSKRSTPLRQDRWALPGALADGRRSLAEIAGEIVMKLTGVETPPPLFQLCAVGGPESRPGRFSVSCAYLALLRSPCLSDKSEAEECQWRRLSLPGEPKDLDDGEPVLTITSLPGDLDADALDFSVPSEDAASTEVLSSDLPLSFEHGRMIQAALLKIRANPLRHHAVRRLLPERFTLKHLQSFTELILGRNLLTPAFRRKIAPLVRPTEDFVRDKRFRPSRLFQFQEQKSEG